MIEPTSREPLGFAQALALLRDPDAPPAAGVVDGLSSPTNDQLEAFRRCWSELPVPRRRWVAEALLNACEADIHVDFRRLFVAMLDDGDAEVRSTAIEGLWEANDAYLAERFARTLVADAEPIVRATAATALGAYVEMGQLGTLDANTTRTTLDALVAVARDEGEDTEVRRRATESAGYADYEDAGAVIEEMFASDDRTLRAGALRAMGHSADARWGHIVVEMLDDAEPELRFEAARASGELALLDAVSKLAWMAAEADREIQLEAIWSLGEIGGRDAQRALESVLASSADEQLDEAVEDALATAALWEGDLFWGAAPEIE